MWRLLATTVLFFLFATSIARADCNTATPPAAASAVGLTRLVLCDDFLNSNSIDVNDTRDPTSCPNATFPNGVCHWFVHNRWPNAALQNCGTNNSWQNRCWQSYVPTTTADFSTGAGGLTLAPQAGSTTGNNTSGTSTITGLASTAGLPTVGLIYGTGIPVNTTATISGTTAALTKADGSAQNTTSGTTGGTYYFQHVLNGSMFWTCATSAGSGGYVGTTFLGNFYVEIQATVPSQGAQFTSIESWAEGWALPVEAMTLGLGIGITYAELDFFEAPYGRHLHSITVDGAGGFTDAADYGIAPPLGTMPLGMLITNSGNGGALNNVGNIVRLNNGSVTDTVTYGPTVAPANGGGSLGFPVGTFKQAGSMHYCLILDAAPNWTMSNVSVRVWQAAIGAGRRAANDNKPAPLGLIAGERWRGRVQR